MLKMRLQAALVVAATLLCGGSVLACTSGKYQDPDDKATVISWRLLDLPSSYLNQLAYVPAGTQLELLPVKGSNTYSTLGRYVPVRNSFMCFTSSVDILTIAVEALLPGLKIDHKKWPGSCIDGFNTKGLGIGALMQLDSTGISNYTGGAAIENVDVPAYILATYDDVPSLEANLVAGKLNFVLNPATSPILKAMFNTTYSEVHYNIIDAQNRGLVIEYSGPKNLQWYRNDQYGALANNPLYPAQLQYMQSWIQANSDPYTTIHDSVFLNMPGSYNSSHRFMRAAMIKQPMEDWTWPSNIAISPKYYFAPMPSTNPALMAAMSALSSVYLPKGIDDAGGQQGAGMSTHRDIVYYTILRDHKLNTLYWRVANTPQYKRISLQNVNWRLMSKKGIRRIWLNPGQWWVDETNYWMRQPNPVPAVRQVLAEGNQEFQRIINSLVKA